MSSTGGEQKRLRAWPEEEEAADSDRARRLAVLPWDTGVSPEERGRSRAQVTKARRGSSKATCAVGGREELHTITRRDQAGFGEKQEELAGTRRGTEGRKGPDHPKASCWDAGDADRGEGTSSSYLSTVERLCCIRRGLLR